MKNTFALIALTMSVQIASIASAATYDSSWYKATYWPGEYPVGIATTKNVSVLGRSEPRTTAVKDVRCELPAGMLIHEWSQKEAQRKTDFIYWSRVMKYKALTDLDEVDEIKAGDVVEELAYGSEGACLLKVNQVEFVGMCPGNGGSESTYELLSAEQDAGFELWAGIQCLNGTKAYLPLEVSGSQSEELQKEIDALEIAGIKASGDMLLGYGEVKEDQVLAIDEIKEHALTFVLNEDSAAGQVGSKYTVVSAQHIFKKGYMISVSRKVGSKQITSSVLVSYKGKTSL